MDSRDYLQLPLGSPRRPRAREWVAIALVLALVVAWVVPRPSLTYIEDSQGSRWIFVVGDSGPDPNPVLSGPQSGQRRILIRGIYRGLPVSRSGRLGCAATSTSLCLGPRGFSVESSPGHALYAVTFANYRPKRQP